MMHFDLINFVMLAAAICLNCLFIIGIYAFFNLPFSYGRHIGAAAEMYLPEWVHKPLMTCPPCMSSVYGLLFAVPIYTDISEAHQVMQIALIIVHIFCVLGLNSMVVFLFDKVDELDED